MPVHRPNAPRPSLRGSGLLLDVGPGALLRCERPADAALRGSRFTGGLVADVGPVPLQAAAFVFMSLVVLDASNCQAAETWVNAASTVYLITEQVCSTLGR